MSEELINNTLEKLSLILKSLQKNPYRRYKYRTLVDKLSSAKILYALAIEEINLLKESKQAPLLKQFRFFQGNIITLVNERLANNIEPLSFKTLLEFYLKKTNAPWKKIDYWSFSNKTPDL